MTDEPRPRRLGRLSLWLGALALAGSAAFATWWTTTLTGLPDVGDPFDVEAFCRPIPDETNAFVLYREATALLSKEPPNVEGDWKTASPAERGWLDRSREALAIWRRGTERPDALYINPGSLTFETRLNVVQELRILGRLALLEGSRLEEQGDFAGALDWYIALLRSSRHCGRRSTLIERLIGVAMHRWAVTRLNRWALEPKVDAPMLRRALQAAIEAERATPPTSDSLKAEYISFLHALADPELMIKVHLAQVEPDGQGGGVTKYGQDDWKASLIRVRRRMIHEPERSRRLIRLVWANWLLYCDLPPSRQPPRVLPGVPLTVTDPATVLLGCLFVVGDDAPATARTLPPEKLVRWFTSSIDASALLPAWAAVQRAIARETSAQGTLMVTLANELYRREHGRDPERFEDLVGPYLKALPEGYRGTIDPLKTPPAAGTDPAPPPPR